MRENDFINIQENNNEEKEYMDPMMGACSAEFPEGCIFCDDDQWSLILDKLDLVSVLLLILKIKSTTLLAQFFFGYPRKLMPVS